MEKDNKINESCDKADILEDSPRKIVKTEFNSVLHVNLQLDLSLISFIIFRI